MKIPPLPYYFLRTVGVSLLKLYFRLESEGVENIPQEGSAIIVANHASFIDPLVIATTVPRKIGFMILESFYRKPVINWLCSCTTCIPVPEKDSGHQALRYAIEYLKNGNALCIFPEGGRSPDGKLQEAKTGTAFIALKTGTPVIPAAIIGNFRAYSRHHKIPRPYKVVVRYGKPIMFGKGDDFNKDDLREATQVIMEEIRRLLK